MIDTDAVQRRLPACEHAWQTRSFTAWYMKAPA